jgi:hypothetical protein
MKHIYYITTKGKICRYDYGNIVHDLGQFLHLVVLRLISKFPVTKGKSKCSLKLLQPNFVNENYTMKSTFKHF